MSIVQSETAGTNVTRQLFQQKEEEMAFATRCLHHLFTSLQYLLKQGLALRGHDDAAGNLEQLLQLRSSDLPELSTWLTRSTKWLSHDIQNEIMELMSHSIIRDIVQRILKNGQFGIIIDESADNTRQEQLVFCLRSVDQEMSVQEYFIGLHKMDKCDAATIATVVKDILLRLGLSLTNCRSLCTDGASVMIGSETGLAARLKEEEPRVLSSHCSMHGLNLAVQEVVSQNPLMRDFLQLLQSLTTFLRDSPKRCEIFKEVAKETGLNQTHIRPLCPTRFSVKYRSIQLARVQYKAVIETLEQIEADARDIKIKSQASGFVKRMTEFEYYFSLCISHHIFEVTDRLSCQLQKKTIAVCEAEKCIEFALKELTQMRENGKFDNIWHDAKVLTESVDGRMPELPRQRKIPRRIDTGPSPNAAPANAKDLYRRQYLEIVDYATSNLNKRLTGKSNVIMKAIERSVVAGASGNQVNQDDITILTNHYTNDVSDRVAAQLPLLSLLPKENQEKVTMQSVIQIIQSNPERSSMLPEVVNLLRLYLVMPSTTATAERSFSHLRRVKNYLRSTMGQSRLNHCMVLYSYKDEVDK
jgi:hypothetical protein